MQRLSEILKGVTESDDGEDLCPVTGEPHACEARDDSDGGACEGCEGPDEEEDDEEGDEADESRKVWVARLIEAARAKAMGEATEGGARQFMSRGTLKQLEVDLTVVRDLVGKAERQLQQDLKEGLKELAYQAYVDVALEGKFLTVTVELPIPEDPRKWEPEGTREAFFDQAKAWAKGAIPWPVDVAGKHGRIVITGQKMVW